MEHRFRKGEEENSPQERYPEFSPEVERRLDGAMIAYHIIDKLLPNIYEKKGHLSGDNFMLVEMLNLLWSVKKRLNYPFNFEDLKWQGTTILLAHRELLGKGFSFNRDINESVLNLARTLLEIFPENS